MNFFWSLVHKRAAPEALFQQFWESKLLGTSNGTVARTSVTLEFIKTAHRKKKKKIIPLRVLMDLCSAQQIKLDDELKKCFVLITYYYKSRPLCVATWALERGSINKTSIVIPEIKKKTLAFLSINYSCLYA